MPTIARAQGVRYKTLDASIQDVTGRHIEFIASQEVQDRDGDVIECAGIDCADFMRNPIFLGDHDKTFLLGKISKAWKERLPDGPALLMKAELLPPGVSARADERYAAIKFGAAKGISIGFLSRQHEPTPTGYRYKSVSLMEVSQVSIPSCPTCIITQKSTKEASMYGTALENRVARQLAELFDGQIEKEPDDWFESMLAQMRQHVPANNEYLMMMNAQMARLGADATIGDLCRAIMEAGAYQEPKSWRGDDLVEFDERDLALAVARVVADEIPRATRAALNQTLGRLD